MGDVVSVVIPALNESATIARVVKEIASSPFVAETIVVDNGSDDGTADVAADAGAIVVVEPRRGFGRALKTGYAAAQCELVFKIDADMRNMTADWVARHVELIDDTVGVVKAYWSSGEDPMPVTNLVVRPTLRRFFPSLSGIHMPISGVYLVRRALLDIESMVDGWPFDLEVLIRAQRGGYKIRQLYLGEVRDTLKPISAYHSMAAEMITYLAKEGGAPPDERLLFVMAHPDDVEIWCGGTLFKYLAIGAQVTIVILTGDHVRTGEAERMWGAHPLVNLITLRRPELSASGSDIVAELAKTVELFRPTLVVTHHRGDVHPDHRGCAEAVEATMLAIPRARMPRRLLSCNSYFERSRDHQRFEPDIYVDITIESELKYRAIAEYTSQDTAFWIDMARRMDAMNGFRSGVLAAEAFESWSFYNSPTATTRIP